MIARRFKLKKKGLVIKIIAALIALLIAQSMNKPVSVFAQIGFDATSDQCINGVGEYIDYLGSGRNDSILVKCNFSGLEDTIIIIPKNRIIDTNKPWKENLDYQNAVWIFDAGSDGNANLIIDFNINSDKQLTADLFDDQNNDGVVSYQIQNNQILITENKFPTIKIVSLSGWWTRNEKISYDLDIDIDGPIMAMATYDRFLHLLSTDGVIDFKIKVRDTNGDGNPDYDFRQATAPLPENWGLCRVNLMVNVDSLLKPIRNYILWPFLGTAYGEPDRTAAGALAMVSYHDNFGRNFGFIQNYNYLSPPIQVRWDRSKIEYLAEIVPSRANDAGWFIYSMPKYESNKLYRGDFENPFAFYNFTSERNGVPDLAVRVESSYPNDPYYDGGSFSEPLSMIRYSWRQNSQQKDYPVWDYSLNLLGRFDTTEVPIRIGDQLLVKSIPYKDFPSWVLDKEWDVATFVQAMNGYSGSEGIYEWNGLNEIRDSYITGQSNKIPLDLFETIYTGYRGEYTIQQGIKPILYLSPIDLQLHLLQAESGQWKLSDQYSIKYENLGGDYINKWQVLENGEITRTLYIMADYIFLEDGQKLQIDKITQPSALFTSLPPRNSQEWKDLGDRLNHYQQNITPGDFQSVIDRSRGTIESIYGAKLRDFRLENSNFRFILELKPGYNFNGSNFFNIEPQNPGQYLVTYDGQFHIQPLTPPNLSLKLSFHEIKSLRLGELIPLQIEIQNTGLEDANNLILLGRAESGKNSIEIGQKPLRILSNETVQSTFDWQPIEAGDWNLHFYIEDSNGRDLVETSNNISISASPQFNILFLPNGIEQKDSNKTRIGYASIAATMILLVASGLFTALVWRIAWSKRDSTSIDSLDH